MMKTMPLILNASFTVVKMAQDLMPGMRLRIKSSSSDSLFGQVQTILANREHGLP